MLKNILSIYSSKYYSVTAMWGELAIPDFDSVIVNSKIVLNVKPCCATAVLLYILWVCMSFDTVDASY